MDNGGGRTRGILLAGGTGSRLWPATRAVSKQLIPVYDKPMVYYPLATLISSGIREIVIITTPEESGQFQRLLGNGHQWGIELRYAVQPRPEGIAQAFLIAEEFLAGGPAALILGDNLFHGVDLRPFVELCDGLSGGRIFGYPVTDPTAFGVVEFDDLGRVLSIEEKPARPRSRYAVPGFYLYDSEVVPIARAIGRSARGEYEITAVNEEYLRRGALQVTVLGTGTAWLDTGTVADLVRAQEYVRAIDTGQGTKVGCVEEAAWRAGFIDDDQLRELAAPLLRSDYGSYLLRLLHAGDRVGPREQLLTALD
ncbi:glucose-1-phosphate thymidylyltransferase RfbA [Jidongwangia harbinensis]|uniref:glucose-1-phosphate thymidylyltransferase RfbA n=1 Tax=Jidongwangia harbinensis TaxID=2878561 RepID=UPI001CDA0762|nr:glucose-1-phosphate thymidylyltransferase RfbA [Jidongwangia harbinensis]MCA2217209.1 glucose-1-phosphate thymidylyltransferase RfbA [Jidongwangia harbinensis]